MPAAGGFVRDGFEGHMTRYAYIKRFTGIAGFVAVALAISAVPAGSTIKCPPGVTPPSPYCTNVFPTATTGNATGVAVTSAVLHGVAGPGVANGDSTDYFFEYGTTTAYGSDTPTGTVPAGPATEGVSADITGLLPGTTYHFRLVSTNSDGTRDGSDVTLATLPAVVVPPVVTPNQTFSTTTVLDSPGQITISFVPSSGPSRDAGAARGPQPVVLFTGVVKGTFHVYITAPGKPGKYTLTTSVKIGRHRSTVRKTITVVKKKRHGRLAATSADGLSAGAALAFPRAPNPITYIPNRVRPGQLFPVSAALRSTTTISISLVLSRRQQKPIFSGALLGRFTVYAYAPSTPGKYTLRTTVKVGRTTYTFTRTITVRR